LVLIWGGGDSLLEEVKPLWLPKLRGGLEFEFFQVVPHKCFCGAALSKNKSLTSFSIILLRNNVIGLVDNKKQTTRMNSRFIEVMLNTGSGIFFSRLLFDVLSVFPVFYFIQKIFVPVIRQYRLALHLDQICGSEPRHWFYGHMKRVNFTYLIFGNI